MTEHLLVIRDGDIFDSVIKLDNSEYTIRTAVKVIILDQDDNVALVGTKYRLLPGGGVEEGETLEEAVVRECKEEVGCDVRIGRNIGTTDEYRTKSSRHQITHCFVAHVVGEKGNPTTTQEDEQGMQIDWMPIADAYTSLERQVSTIPHESYNSCFNVRCHLAFVRRFMGGALPI